MTDVPFLSHIHRAIELTNSYPYQEIVNYCRIHRNDGQGARLDQYRDARSNLPLPTLSLQCVITTWGRGYSNMGVQYA